MKHILMILIFVIVFFKINFSQDYILLKSGEEIQAWVLEVNEKQIIYTGVQDTVTNYAIAVSDVFMIKYLNGEKLILSTEQTNENTNSEANNYNNNEQAKLSDEEIKQRAISDAHTFYSNSSAQWATGCTTLAIWPCGIGVVALTTMNAPKDKNLKMPTYNYTNSNIYRDYYKATAFKIKKKKVWTVFGICMAINVPLIILSMMNPY